MLPELLDQIPADVELGTVTADATNLSSNFGSLVALRTEPATRVDLVVLVPAGRSVSGSVVDRLTESFRAAGWDPPADDDVDDGLPSGGVLAAVRTVWGS